MLHADNGRAMNDGKNISSKVTNFYKNAIRKACLTGEKRTKEGKGAYCFYLENITV